MKPCCEQEELTPTSRPIILLGDHHRNVPSQCNVERRTVLTHELNEYRSHIFSGRIHANGSSLDLLGLHVTQRPYYKSNRYYKRVIASPRADQVLDLPLIQCTLCWNGAMIPRGCDDSVLDLAHTVCSR